MNGIRWQPAWLSGLGLLLLSTCVGAQNADELAKQLSNPIASLTSVPMQFNYDDGFGADEDGSRFSVNVQPVIPVSISDEWNMISRTIIPLISQDEIQPGAGSQSGVGDVLQSLFFSPKALTGSGWTWGVGPALLVPTASDDLLGADKWAGGPTCGCAQADRRRLDLRRPGESSVVFRRCPFRVRAGLLSS